MKNSRSLRSRKKQTRLSFEPVASSSPTVSTYSPAVQSRLANVRFEGAKSTSKISLRSNNHDESNLLPTPEPSSQPQITIEKESSPLSDTPSTPKKPANKLDKVQVEEQETDEDEEIIAPSSKRRRLEDAASLTTPARRSARFKGIDTPDSNLLLRSKRQSARLTSSPPVAKVSSVGSAETSGDEEQVLFTQPTYRCRNSRPVRKDDPFAVSTDDEAVEKVSRTPLKKSKGLAHGFVVDDDEIEYISSDEEAVRQKPRSKRKNKRKDRSRKEQDELEDDLADLQDSDQSDIIEIQRTRGGPVTTQRDKNRELFEELKRRRAGEPIPRILDSDDEDDDVGLHEDDGVDIDEVAFGSSTSRTRHNVQPSDSSDNGEDRQVELRDQGNDDLEDDFVVDDESQSANAIGSGIPLEFTSFASRKPRELFIYIIEWLIKNKIAPAFSRDDELYILSWNKINDQIKAQAGSRLISSAWSEDFKNAVLARPHMQVHLVTEGSDDIFLNCDACNRTNHPARYEFKFEGQAYHKDTLEPIDNENSDDEADEADEANDADDTASYDQQGHRLPSTHRTYNLGRFCAANAEMGHKLTHWKHHLNQSLLDYLEEQGVLSAEAIVAREKLNKKKREKEAENIVDQMQETGMVDQLWRGLQDDLEDARFGMEDHVAKGGRRNQHRIGKVRVDQGNGRVEEWSEGGRMKLVIPDDSDAD